MGIWYDNYEGGAGNFSQASGYCSSKGMRLANRNETTILRGDGVPATASFWLGSFYAYGGCSDTHQTTTAECAWATSASNIRCVR